MSEKKPKVSVIVPTYGRQSLFPFLYDCFLQQKYEEKELLIYDDSPSPSSFFDGLPNVHYVYSADKKTIGYKRNVLAEMAGGEIIAHFDDDDYYASHYLDVMVARIKNVDFVHLKGWFVFGVSQKAFGFWQTDQSASLNYVFQSKKPLGLVKGMGANDSFVRGYGFSYVYRKKVWEALPFPDRNHGEDYAWVSEFDSSVRIHSSIDDIGLVLHFIHLSNTSRCFPQYILPGTLLRRLFGTSVLRYFNLPLSQ
jgi:glycosyltransferase involved in cell wall biosynthesis